LSNWELSPTPRSNKPKSPLSVENPLDIGGKTPPPGEILDGLVKLMKLWQGEMKPKRDIREP
jgi:hypothetical protein